MTTVSCLGRRSGVVPEERESGLLCWWRIIQYCINYLHNIAVGLVIYSKARAFKAKAKSSRPRPENPKAKKFGFKAKAKD